MKVLAYVAVSGDIDEDNMTQDEKEELLDEIMDMAGESTCTTVTLNVVEFIKEDN